MPETVAPATVQDLIDAMTAAFNAKAAPVAPASPTIPAELVAEVETLFNKVKAANAAGVGELSGTASFFGSAHGLTRIAEYVIGAFAVAGVVAVADVALHFFKVL